jgi:pimeloyl-ACP methyl ester carboxylesterase
VDPRGLGASSTPASGYDLDTVAGDIQSVIRAIAPDGRVDLVGHDLGAWIAHAVASEGTGSLASVALVDAAIPGITAEPTGYPSDHANVRSWHFAFNRLPELP